MPAAVTAAAIAGLGASLWPTVGASVFAVALPFAVLAFVLFAWAPIRRRHLRVDLHTAGIVVTQGRRSSTVLFEDVDEVWLVLDRLRLPTGTFALITGLRLVLHDRSVRRIPMVLQGADAIVRAVQLHCSRPLEAAALEALRAGETLTFGRIQLDRTALRGPSWTMRWADITLVRRFSGRLSFFGWKHVFPRRTIWIDRVPHPTVFVKLVAECASKTETVRTFRSVDACDMRSESSMRARLLLVAAGAGGTLESGSSEGAVMLPRFHGHQKSHASAVGVFNHGTEAKVVQRAVQGRGGGALQGR